MTEGEDFNETLDQLLIGVDPSDEIARRQAHLRCLDYAQDALADDPDVNRFLTLAAERLGQTRVHLRVVEGGVPRPEGARLHLADTEDGGPCLTGNADGLRYLGDLAAALSAAPAPHEHVHLYAGEPPLFGSSSGLTLYHEPDDWFDRHAVAPEDADGGESVGETDGPPREIAVESVAALEFFDDAPLPPPLLLSFDKLYRVRAHRPYAEAEDVWTKADVGRDLGRKYVFSLHDDAGAPCEIALPLDDPDVRYFTFRDLGQFLPRTDGDAG